MNNALHSPAKSAHATRERPRFSMGQRVWFVKGPGRALQPHPYHIGQYGRVDAMQFIGDSWVYIVRCRGKADTVDECCLVANPI